MLLDAGGCGHESLSLDAGKSTALYSVRYFLKVLSNRDSTKFATSMVKLEKISARR